jgi:hypothetical protein
MARRSRRGRGTVFWDATRGCYVGQLSLGRDPQTGLRRRGPKVYAATYDEARDLVDQQYTELKHTGAVAPRDVTVEMPLRDLLASPPAEWASPPDAARERRPDRPDHRGDRRHQFAAADGRPGGADAPRHGRRGCVE